MHHKSKDIQNEKFFEKTSQFHYIEHLYSYIS
jgi:hypothetical protein